MRSNRVTIQDIARHANVSKATVSRVMNTPEIVQPGKREAVLTAMGELGFQPNALARGLASGRSMTIGIVTQNIGTSFYDAVIHAIRTGLRDFAYEPIISDGEFNQTEEGTALRTLSDRQVDGLIMLGGDASVKDLDTARAQKPLLVVARRVPDWDGTCISVDNFKIGYTATEYLIRSGHRSIAHITGALDHDDAICRQEGYLQAIRDAGLKLDRELIYEGNFYGQSGVLAIESWLMKGKNFSAIFAANDLTAFGARLALSRRNIRVPDEVSIVGVDDQIESALMSPPLTTIRQPAKEIGQTAARGIVDLIAGKSVDSRIYHGELVIRESVSDVH